MSLDKKILIYAGTVFFMTNLSFANEHCQKENFKVIRNDGKASNIWKIETEKEVYVEKCLFKSIMQTLPRYRHLIFAISNVESNLNPNTKKGTASEIGPMQILPSTKILLEKEFNEKFNLDSLTGNIYASAKYLQYLEKQIENYCGIITDTNIYLPLLSATYNAGHGHLVKACSLSNFPKSTQSYANLVKNAYYKNYRSAIISGK